MSEIGVIVADDAETVRLAKESHPDVVIRDIAMIQLGGIEASRQFQAQTTQCFHRNPTVHVKSWTCLAKL